jgi:hypothetical protein
VLAPENLYNLEYWDEEQPTKTYKINWVTGRIDGYIDGREALEQAVRCTLQTERFVYPIYDENYGVEILETIGEDHETVRAVLPANIREALLADDRIEDAEIDIDIIGTNAVCSIKIQTIYGELVAELEA